MEVGSNICKIAVCLIVKDENDYLQEWLAHYRNIGVDHFFIYDNNSQIPIELKDQDVTVIKWTDDAFASQLRAYTNCCHNTEYDYIGFLDTDEFYMSKTMNIKLDFENFKKLYGNFEAIGLYWRMYGKTAPFLEERQPVTEYKQWHKNNHIKTFVNPKAVLGFPDPHKPIIRGKFIDELGRNVTSSIGNHTSETAWIKHIWTRSIPEFTEKLQRGSGDKVKRVYTFKDFVNYNDNCVNKDE